MYLLIPGRHHLLTRFQAEYLQELLSAPPQERLDVNGNPLQIETPIEGIVFAVTSANHSGTKRNPIPFHLRAITIQEFAASLSVPVYIFGIDDVGHLDDFAGYTLKTIRHQSEERLDLTPQNTAIVCSTPVMDMYIERGFQILPAELEDKDFQTFRAPLPWDLVEQIANETDWEKKLAITEQLNPSTLKIWQTYALGEKVATILNDPIIGNDGDITESRDYSSYVRQMDEIAEIKFKDTAPFIRPGRVGDIGCAVGSWIRQACQDERNRESDFYGIELARKLFDICQQRKHNGEFVNPSVFFAKKNAVSDLVFRHNSMDTIHTSSLTHEIESYGSRQDLLAFIKNRYAELKSGGVWINRDVVGPENGDQEVYLWLTDSDGSNGDPYQNFSTSKELSAHLDQLSTRARFLRFAQDFRKGQSGAISYASEERDGETYFRLSYRDAAEFLLTKDYTDNWESEMRETFCFWDFPTWKTALEEADFRISPSSHAYTNPWIAQNRWQDKVSLYSNLDTLTQHPLPPTNMLLVAERI
ncbi:methyltransferase domain-containing protein [Pelagicoccus enzymogenes]|uniref:methyltransferase domain-containing protein n=1 Tax=Pelagicoccus enzymogenes TaxID=2773457 RepID=UPI00280FC8FF|nr:methyltransferase domain-containing protein [Pelagicoccus enzymogenes]MDQ8199903.1 methyltransferase domain-containing protein [Pelagicoccus enzymogenes]